MNRWCGAELACTRFAGLGGVRPAMHIDWAGLFIIDTDSR